MTSYKGVRRLSTADAAYLAGLVDGEGTVALSHKHKGEHRQLLVSISNTERQILDFVLMTVGAGKITGKRRAKIHHALSYTYAAWNRQALSVLVQILPYMHSYKRARAQLVIDHYVRLTPRNGKYSDSLRAERERFVDAFLRLRSGVSSEFVGRSPFGLAAEGDVGGGGGTADSASFEAGWTMPSS